jgi:hypothetical protein
MIEEVTSKGLLTHADIQLLTVAYAEYQNYTSQMSQLSGSAKWEVGQQLSGAMTSLASDPAASKIAYFLTEVLAKAPTTR